MPLQKIQFRPGTNREGTTYSNEGGWYETEKVRFRSGFPEKIGGWANLAAQSASGVANTFKGVARNMWNWVTLAFSNLNAVGTNQKFYIEAGGFYNDVTPIGGAIDGETAGDFASGPISTIDGSTLVTFTCAASHGVNAGTYVVIADAEEVAGIPITELNGEHEIISTPTATSFTFLVTTLANATVASGGGVEPPTATFNIPAGNAIYTVGTGWGAGVWNAALCGNNTTTLAADIDSTATDIAVVSTTGFADPAGFLLIESEVVEYTGVDSGTNTFTGCTRGSNATDHIAGVEVCDYAGETSGDDAIGWGDPANPTAVGIGQQLRLWSSDNFGQNLIFAPRGGAIYYWATPGSATSFPAAVTLQSAADAAGYTAVVYGSYEEWEYIPNKVLQIIASDTQRFVIAFGANAYDPTNPDTTFNPLLVRWSDQEDPYMWVPSSSNQSGDFALANGSTIIAARLARQEILIWTDSSLHSMQYLGPPYVWGFNLLMDNISIISPNAMASVNNVTYWMGVDKFYTYSGRVETLPCALRQYVFGDINQDQAFQIQCGTNEGYNEIWWFYPSAGSTVNDRYVIYNHLERIWYYGSINRTTWLDSALRQNPMGAFSIQESYLSVAIDSSQTSISLLNGYTYPQAGTVVIEDEEITYTGHDAADGNTLTGCVRGANNTTAASHGQYTTVTYKVPNQVMYHEVGVDDNSLPESQPIIAYIESSDFDIGDGHNFGFVWRMLPDVNFNGSTVAQPQITITLRPRQNSGTAYGVSDTPTVTSTNNYALSRVYNVQKFTGQVYTRVRARQMAFKVESTGLGTAWQLGVPRIDIRLDGRR